MENSLVKRFGPSSGAGAIYNEIHSIFMTVKLAHFNTSSYAQHMAFGSIYETLEGLTDSIVEQLIGYSGEYPKSLAIGSVEVKNIQEVSKMIMDFGMKLQELARKNNYPNIENLAQEYSGAGAQLKFLSKYP
jgi:DNA-binding ferritin-like protein